MLSDLSLEFFKVVAAQASMLLLQARKVQQSVELRLTIDLECNLVMFVMNAALLVLQPHFDLLNMRQTF